MHTFEIVNKYDPKLLRPGENDAQFKFEGPGVVVLAREEPGTTYSTVLDVLAAEDALAVAKSLLKQPRPDDRYRYAMLLSIRDRAKRESVAAILAANKPK